MSTLPNDIARCDGEHAFCGDCRRREGVTNPDHAFWFLYPPILNGTCDKKITSDPQTEPS